eukprot:SM000063S19990  [mRNA]  locus=s63:124525:126718:- [translate_table: standard]
MDEGTYLARMQRIASMMDIRTAFISDSQLQDALELLRKHEAGEQRFPDEQVARARRIKDAVIHPDTGHKILLPLRLSFIVPCNLVLDTLMLSARGTWQNVAAQWLNQTYNSLHYYANRNASNQEATSKIVEAYIGATGSSVGAALGLNSLLDRLPPSTRWAPLARRMIPFCAVAAADVLNLGITRRVEFLEGIKVYDRHGNEVGRSKVAGASAVGACIGGRIAAAAPILVIPPLIMHRLEAIPLFVQRPWLRTSALMAMIGLSIQVSVPVCFGIFKQQATIKSEHLEEEFHNKLNSHGQKLEYLYYNKGI